MSAPKSVKTISKSHINYELCLIKSLLFQLEQEKHDLLLRLDALHAQKTLLSPKNMPITVINQEWLNQFVSIW